MPAWLQGALMSVSWFVLPRCGFSLTLFCNYTQLMLPSTGSMYRPNTARLQLLGSTTTSTHESNRRTLTGTATKHESAVGRGEANRGQDDGGGGMVGARGGRRRWGRGETGGWGAEALECHVP